VSERRTGHRLARIVLAAASALALCAAFPPWDLWWLAPLGIALLGLAAWRSRPAFALLVGLVHGLLFYGQTLWWAGTYVGRVPWFALAVLEALYATAMVWVTVVAQRWLVQRCRYALALLVVPLAWVGQELARSTTPYGGFPWVRVAFSQSGSPLVRVASVAGAPGVTFTTALVGAGLLGAGLALRRRGVRRALAPALVAVAVPVACLAIPTPTGGRPVTIGLVQGNVPRPGLDFNAERRAVLDNHVRETVAMARDEPHDLSLVVWPENSPDIDPTRNADAREQVLRAQAVVGVPLVVGAVLDEPAGSLSNVSLLYRSATAEPERYVKQHPVPFAEYIPDWDFFARFSDAVRYVRAPFVAGDRAGKFGVAAAGLPGGYWAVPTICFEVAYDGLMRESVREASDRPSVLLVQTNNATFGYSAESEQQFAISRLRAIEHGRSVVHVSTVGVSGFVNPDGTTSRTTSLFTADHIVASPVARTGETISDRVGAWPEWIATAFLLLLAVPGLRRRTQ
jgi:apolipoprotein N-acyltransferase